MGRLNDSEDDDDFRPSEDQLGTEREVLWEDEERLVQLKKARPGEVMKKDTDASYSI
jgi:hypothetical protein